MRLLGVSKRYRARGPWVLRDIDAELAPGQLVRVTGPNGCGKSTLLRLVCGASAPSRGRIVARPRAGRAGYVPERFPPALPFTVRGYLTHLGRVQGLRGARLDGAVSALIGRLGLSPYAGLPLRELSKGSCQKVAVAQALLGQPDLLVLDEAWTGLDAETRVSLDTAVRERLAAGATVLFVDHDPARLADRVSTQWSLRNAQLIESHVTDGTAEVFGADEEVGEAREAGEVDAEAELAGQTVVIEFSGLERDPGLLQKLPGVTSAGSDWVRVRAGRSDDALRWLLGAGGVHVQRVTASDDRAVTGRDRSVTGP